jgi:quercetin dioxygenase-like cupin family protein
LHVVVIGGVPPAYLDAHRNPIRGGTAMNSDSNRDLTQLSPLWRAPGTGPTLDVLGVTHIYKAMANETGHQFSVWESIVPPGAGAPAHTHTREDEAFYVLSGEVLIEVEGAADPLRLGPGGFLFAPRNRRHAYRNIGTVAAHLLVFAIPGAGLDRMFAAFDAASKRTAHMPAIDTIAAIAEQYGVVVIRRLGKERKAPRRRPPAGRAALLGCLISGSTSFGRRPNCCRLIHDSKHLYFDELLGLS